MGYKSLPYPRVQFIFAKVRVLQIAVQDPVVAIVEAENDIIKSGIGQWIAEMLVAQTFNTQRGNHMPTVYSVVTTGSVWKFLRLTDSLVLADERDHYIKEVERIVGVLLAMVMSQASRLSDAIQLMLLAVTNASGAPVS